MRRILVPIDGSPCSTKALREAKKLATAVGSKLFIITVIDSIRYLDMDYKFDAVKDGIALSKQFLESARKELEGFNGEIETVYKTGDVTEEILEYAKEVNTDLIIMGSRGLGIFSRAILGSVSNKVIQHSDINVMVVKGCKE